MLSSVTLRKPVLSEQELEHFIFGTKVYFGGAEDSGSEEEEVQNVSLGENDDFGFFIDTGNAENDEKCNQEKLNSPASEQDAESDGGSEKVTTDCVWLDEDQEALESVNLQAKNRTKKLKRSFEEVQVSGKEYEERLRAQFQKIHPTPDWAKITEETGQETNDLLTTSKPLVQKGPTLNPDKLLVIRAKDANQAEYGQVSLHRVYNMNILS